MKAVNQQQWEQGIETYPNAVILDVRTDAEWQEGRLPGAQQLDISKVDAFKNAVAEMDRDQHYFIYCRSGMRSANACQYMEQLGFLNTYNLEGGITAWRGPVEK